MEIIVTNQQLPTKFEDVAQFAVLAQEKLKSVKAEINAIKRLGLARDVYEQKKAEAQELAELTVRAEVKLGEITSNMPTAQGARTDLTSLPQGKEVVTKQAALKGANINAKRASHYEAMAAHPEIVEAAITEARENDDIVSRSFVLEKIKAKEKEQKQADRRDELQNPTNLPDGVFQVVYCDPPWQYSNSGFNSSAEQHYPTMNMDELKAMPVKGMRAENAVMFMWATNPLLKEAIELMEAWGFEYKTNIAWVKDRQINLGFYVYGKHELLLIGTNGSMLPIGEKPSSVMTGTNRIHSKKPESTYELIEGMYPQLKYIELFARNTPRKGWVKWGNEVGKYE
jgi:N6-adenosine-specific RNA methylase IME4